MINTRVSKKTTGSSSSHVQLFFLMPLVTSLVGFLFLVEKKKWVRCWFDWFRMVSNHPFLFNCHCCDYYYYDRDWFLLTAIALTVYIFFTFVVIYFLLNKLHYASQWVLVYPRVQEQLFNSSSHFFLYLSYFLFWLSFDSDSILRLSERTDKSYIKMCGWIGITVLLFIIKYSQIFPFEWVGRAEQKNMFTLKQPLTGQPYFVEMM